MIHRPSSTIIDDHRPSSTINRHHPNRISHPRTTTTTAVLPLSFSSMPDGTNTFHLPTYPPNHSFLMLNFVVFCRTCLQSTSGRSSVTTETCQAGSIDTTNEFTSELSSTCHMQSSSSWKTCPCLGNRCVRPKKPKQTGNIISQLAHGYPYL